MAQNAQTRNAAKPANPARPSRTDPTKKSKYPAIPKRFSHITNPVYHNGGVRLPVWDDLNVALLGKAIGVTAYHLRYVLTGRRDGSPRLFWQVAKALGWMESEVKDVIRSASSNYGLDGKRFRSQTGFVQVCDR